MVEDIQGVIEYLANEYRGSIPLLVAHDQSAGICWEYAKQGKMTEHKEIAGYASLAILPGEYFEANLGLKQLWASLYMAFFNMSQVLEKAFLACNAWFVRGCMNATKTSILLSQISNTYCNNYLQDGAITSQLNYNRTAIQIGSKTDSKDVLGPSRYKGKGKDEIRRLDLPVLMIRGKDDDTLTDAVFRGYEHYLSNAKLITLDECSHQIQADKSDEVNKSLEKFLEEL